MKALVGAFNQEIALVWAFSVIVKTDGSLYLLLPARTQSCHVGGLGEEREERAELVAEMDTKIRELTEAVTSKDQELKRLNPSLAANDELSVESALGRAFQKQLQAELDPVWHQLSWKTKQLVADLRTLRTVILYLTQVK